MKLRLAHLYPKLLNIYGDRGNVLTLKRRCEARGIEFEVNELTVGDAFNPGEHDIIFIGGAQDQEQRRVAEDLVNLKAAPLRDAVEGGLVMLAVCGGYQLMGRYYKDADGRELPGAGVLDLWTRHPGQGSKRFVGNVVAKWNGTTLVGFENHGGRTYLGERAQPLASVVTGHGNNGEDRTEGAIYRNVYGTYLHGSLLPKNPRFADHLIRLALQPSLGDAPLQPLDDIVEEMAHQEAIRVATKRGVFGLGG